MGVTMSSRAIKCMMISMMIQDQSAPEEALDMLKGVVDNPKEYPELFEKEISDWIDSDSEVRILSKYYSAIEVVKAVDPIRYDALIEGFFDEVFNPNESPTMEKIIDLIEDIS